MPATIQNSIVYLAADGFGYQAAKAPLPVPPSGMTGMYFVFRAYFNGSEQNTIPGWDHTFAFGLCFNGINPTQTSRANFFGIASDPSDSPSAVGIRGSSYAFMFSNGNYMGGESYGVYQQPANFYSGRASGAMTIGNRIDQIGCLPSGASSGAYYTGVWVIKKAGIDQVSLSVGYNLDAIPVSNLKSAVTSAETKWPWRDLIFTDATNWRLGGNMNFPSHFIAKLPSSVAGRQLIIEKVDMRYFNSETLS